MHYITAKITKQLIKFFGKDDRRINHAISVLIESEKIKDDFPGYDHDIVVACALLHDVGIKPSEKKFGYNNGKTQEEFGPAIAQKLLMEVGFASKKIKKVKAIIGNHHSPSRYDYPELKILKAADMAVNRAESKK